MKIPEKKHISEIIKFGERIYQAGWMPATDGNISVKISSDRILITRSGTCKGELETIDIIECNQYGKVIGDGKVSSEIHMHLRVYKARSDVKAVIHAHPPMVISCSLAGIDLSEPLLPEILMTLGSIPTAEFAVPSSEESAKVIEKLVIDHNAIILDRHGSVTVGSALTEAYQRLERLEFAAGIVYQAKLAGNVKVITQDEIRRINASAEKYSKMLIIQRNNNPTD